MTNNKDLKSNSEVVIFESEDGQISFDVNIIGETVWLSQKQMAELFDKSQRTISEHILNIFTEGELIEDSVYRKFRYTASDGKNYDTKYYNLDVVISVGYRVKSHRGTQFRIWATQILKQYLTNGYVINESKIKSILEHIENLQSEIKTGIKEIYQKLSEIKPINIYNQISLTNNKDMEDKIIELIDQLLKEGKSDKGLKSELEEVKEIIKEPTKDKVSKNKLINFFKRLGDDNSDLNKTIKGAGVASKAVKELVKLGEKLKDLIS